MEVCRYCVVMLMFCLVKILFSVVSMFGWFLWMCIRWCLLCSGSEIFGKFIVESVELLLEYLINLFVIFRLIFFCVFWVELLMCGVRRMLLNLYSGEVNGLLLVVGFVGNMLIVVFVRCLFVSVLYSVGIFIIVLCEVLISSELGFISEIFFVFIIFLVDGFFGICRFIILFIFSRLERCCIWVVLFSGSLFLIL